MAHNNEGVQVPALTGVSDDAGSPGGRSALTPFEQGLAHAGRDRVNAVRDILLNNEVETEVRALTPAQANMVRVLVEAGWPEVDANREARVAFVEDSVDGI